MDWATIGLVLGLMGLGAGLVAWPLYLLLEKRDAEIERLKGLVPKTEAIVGVERDLLDARDLPPADELGVLFGDPPADEPSTP